MMATLQVEFGRWKLLGNTEPDQGEQVLPMARVLCFIERHF